MYSRYYTRSASKNKLITTVVENEPVSVEKPSVDLRFSAAVAMYVMILRESEHSGDITLADV